ncbi:MAG TPA: serine hydrolase domain-containing protein [Flavobacterium sp.]|uniref:serine hydrolase domain-containing protein n=1 Tax=Flavobacterium sp. TaxID=239 RepID=UPI002D1C77FF|nr:serine hydrolase domain-containing protein [Flavobacterium sp.]HSD13032.1 serine hydrolase domain-containing protein [Flavobacterium sp.]
MTGKFFLILILSIFSINCLAQPSSSKLKRSVDSLINSEMQKQRIPGISVVVLRDGNVEYLKGYGFSNIEHKVGVIPETIFQSGSVGKQFTSFAIMLLVEDGKLSLDDKLTKFFPDAPESWGSITIKHLLTHTSGFSDYTSDLNLKADYTEDSLYQIFREKPLLFKAGEKSVYSNMGYVTLGIIISKVTGEFYGNFLKRRIFDPLGMTTARIISENDLVPNRAAGYRLVNGEIKNQLWVSPSVNTTADGSMYVTALDMAKWEAGLNAGKLLKKESYEAMWTPVRLNNGSTFPYGFGWKIDSLNGKRILAHDGTWQGFESTIKRYPEKKLTVIVFANLYKARTNKIATRVMQLFQPELKMTKKVSNSENEPQMRAFVNSFVTKLTENTTTENLFTPVFWKEFHPYAEKVAVYLKPMGTFKNSELLERKDLNQESRLYHYRLFFEKENLEFLITLAKDNKISDYEIRE